jgi:hypothetical protein
MACITLAEHEFDRGGGSLADSLATSSRKEARTFEFIIKLAVIDEEGVRQSSAQSASLQTRTFDGFKGESSHELYRSTINIVLKVRSAEREVILAN